MNITCSKCNQEKDSKKFRRDQHNPTGYHPHCNECFNESMRKWYNSNLDKVRADAREYYRNNASRISELRKARRRKQSREQIYKISTADRVERDLKYQNRVGWKKSMESRWRNRGIKDFSYSDFENMLLLQDGKCYLCGGGPAKNQSLHVDHCHKTGLVRKLLCNNCNNGMGKLKDDPELLIKAANYLKAHE